MHICYLCDEYPPAPHGGVGSFVHTLSRELIKRNHKVSVLGIYHVPKRKEYVDQGVKVIQLPMTEIPFFNIWIHRYMLAMELRLLNETCALDLVEGPELSFAFLPKLAGVRYVIRLHGGHHFFSMELGKKPRLGRGWYEELSFRNADFFCAVSQYVANRSQTWLDMKPPPSIISNPVAMELFAPAEAKEERGLITFVGTVCEKKGIRQLLQAMPVILNAHPEAHLLVIGRDQYDRRLGISFTEYLKQIMDVDTLSHVSFLESINHNELPAFLAKASVCVYPSHMEAMPIAWLEGMAMAKAVVASKTGPGPEIIDDGQDGLLCNPFDPYSIAEKVIHALDDVDLRNRLGQAARKKIELKFSTNTLTKKNLDFYSQCLNDEIR